jgi:hypothetical protein
MASFTPVSSGNPTNATDINQLINALNGTTAAQVSIKSTSNSVFAIGGYLPTTPGADSAVVGAGITGDATFRISQYIQNNGYGAIFAGNGGTPTAYIFAGAGGFTAAPTFTVSGSLTVGGSSSFAGASFSSGVSISGSASLNGGGTVNGGNIPGFIGGGTKISVQGTAPGSPSTNDVWINTSTNLG